MNPFEFMEPESVEEAVSLLMDEPGRAEVIAGGTDLLSELKDGLRRPGRLVSLAELGSCEMFVGRRKDCGWGLH